MKIPEGLLHFESTLASLEYTPKLLNRLKDLPGFDLQDQLNEFKTTMQEVEKAEKELSKKRLNAIKMAENIWKKCLKKWSIPELQEATGYDEED
jgi:hypothetical protein